MRNALVLSFLLFAAAACERETVTLTRTVHRSPAVIATDNPATVAAASGPIGTTGPASPAVPQPPDPWATATSVVPAEAGGNVTATVDPAAPADPWAAPTAIVAPPTGIGGNWSVPAESVDPGAAVPAAIQPWQGPPIGIGGNWSVPAEAPEPGDPWASTAPSVPPVVTTTDDT